MLPSLWAQHVAPQNSKAKARGSAKQWLRQLILMYVALVLIAKSPVFGLSPEYINSL
jgi:hypothetical protein